MTFPEVNTDITIDTTLHSITVYYSKLRFFMPLWISFLSWLCVKQSYHFKKPKGWQNRQWWPDKSKHAMVIYISMMMTFRNNWLKSVARVIHSCVQCSSGGCLGSRLFFLITLIMLEECCCCCCCPEVYFFSLSLHLFLLDGVACLIVHAQITFATELILTGALAIQASPERWRTSTFVAHNFI